MAGQRTVSRGPCELPSELSLLTPDTGVAFGSSEQRGSVSAFAIPPASALKHWDSGQTRQIHKVLINPG